MKYQCIIPWLATFLLVHHFDVVGGVKHLVAKHGICQRLGRFQRQDKHKGKPPIPLHGGIFAYLTQRLVFTINTHFG